jgi:hypothetical protein
VDEGATHASVAVSERVDGLELCVDEARVNDGRVAGAVDVVDEIAHEVGDARGGRRDEIGIKRMVA